MPPALSLRADPASWERLGTIYVAGLWLTTISLYASFIQDGYQPTLVMLALSVGGIASVLLRIAQRLTNDILETDSSPGLIATAELVVRLDCLLQEAQSTRREVGVMLLSLDSLDLSGEHAGLFQRGLSFVRGELFQESGSRVFQLDERTIAIGEAGEDVGERLHIIAMVMRTRWHLSQRSTDLAEGRLSTGIAVAATAGVSAGELLATSRSALRLSRIVGRDVLFSTTDALPG